VLNYRFDIVSLPLDVLVQLLIDMSLISKIIMFVYDTKKNWLVKLV
jgi:hypothetical protein